MAPTTEQQNNSFPYKTLIWMVFAGFAIFIFKAELRGMINNAEELTVFGVTIKTSKKKANELESKIYEYQDDIASLTSQVTDQQIQVDSLLKLKDDLISDLQECPEANIKVPILEGKFQKLSISNTSIKTQSRKLSDMTIFKRKDNLNQ